MDFLHTRMKIVKRSSGRSAAAAAAYRSGTILVNSWDGVSHDYTRKLHIVHSEIMLPSHAPPEYADRSILWNSVEWAETDRNAQLAREIEFSLPAELNHEQHLALVRKYVQKYFVDKGMCADFSIHDKRDGNPHVHILLTMRAIREDGTWAQKSRLVYDLDENGNRIPAKQKGRWKNHKEDFVDWNNRDNGKNGALLLRMPSMKPFTKPASKAMMLIRAPMPNRELAASPRFMKAQPCGLWKRRGFVLTLATKTVPSATGTNKPTNWKHVWQR